MLGFKDEVLIIWRGKGNTFKALVNSDLIVIVEVGDANSANKIAQETRF